MNRIAINIARWAIRYIAWGDKHFVYMDRVRKCQSELDRVHSVFFKNR